MIIKITAKNSSVDFSGQEINLKYAGLYLVVGPNGAGKTTLLQNIVFSPKFEKPNRNYFAYAEQDPEKYNIRIRDYLHRFQSEIDISMQEKLLEHFELTHLDVNANIKSISGGELVKLNLISCLLRKTPFIFMDEPTNNLDDESVKKLIEIIEDIGKERIIVLVSHDPRFHQTKHHTIYVEKNQINIKYDELKVSIKATAQDCKYPGLKIISRHLLRPSTILSVLLTLIYAIAFLLINHIVFMSRYNADKVVKNDGSLLIYNVDSEYGDLSRIFAEKHSIQVNENKYYSMIKYSDITEILEKYTPDNIFIKDMQFADKIYEKIQNQTLLSDPPVISIPQAVQENYMYQIDSLFTTDYLIDGRYPHDGKKEIVMSEALIKSEYPGVQLNDTIKWNEDEYVLTGIHMLDAYIVSYTGENNYLYHYDKDNYDNFVNTQTTYKKQIDMAENDIYTPDCIVMQLKPENEANILKQLFIDYPANNYRSHSYDVDMASYMNKTLIRNSVFMNVLCGLLIGLLLILVNHKRCVLYQTEAMSFDCYYLTKPWTFRMIGIAELITCIFVLIIYIIVGKYVTTFKIEHQIACLGFSVLTFINLLPHLMTIIKKHE